MKGEGPNGGELELDRCEEIRAAMLEASPAALRSGTDSDVGRHLAECAACCRLAGRLLTCNAALDRMLAALAREFVATERTVTARRGKSRRRATSWGAGIAATAAAASAAGLLLMRTPVRMNPTWWPSKAEFAPVADVRVDGDATTVFASRDHLVTVVWLENRGDRGNRDTPRDVEPVEPKEMN